MSKQPIAEIEASYKLPDPWAYQTNPDDIYRRGRLSKISCEFGPYDRVLDIGAGEGWITTIYQAITDLHGYEVSDDAASRFPGNVKRVVKPEGKYDLVAATGVFYGHYHWENFLQLIKNHASKHVLISSIADWELKVVDTIGKELYREEFKYREWKQRLRLFQV